MKVLNCFSWLLSVACFLLTVLFAFGKLGHLGTMGDWSWGQVLAPEGIFVLWVLFWLVLGMIKGTVEVAANHTRDPYRSFEPLRRFRAWRWRKDQQKYGLNDKES